MVMTAAIPCSAVAVRSVSSLRTAPARLAALRPQTASALRVRPGVAVVQRGRASRGAVQTQSAVELFQLANEGAEISTAASVMFAITLVGLAIGFVLLRVEALVEEGEI